MSLTTKGGFRESGFARVKEGENMVDRSRKWDGEGRCVTVDVPNDIGYRKLRRYIQTSRNIYTDVTARGPSVDACPL